MYTPSANPREDFWQGIYALTKIFLGAITGFLSGMFSLSPIIGFLFWLLVIISVFAIFRYLLGLEDAPIKLLLLHGTFASFIAFVLFWGVMIGAPT